jgi:hypothetical protein
MSVTPPHPQDASTFHHLKLIMNKQFISRDGEVSWHQYSSALRQIMVNMALFPGVSTLHAKNREV